MRCYGLKDLFSLLKHEAWLINPSLAFKQFGRGGYRHCTVFAQLIWRAPYSLKWNVEIERKRLLIIWQENNVVREIYSFSPDRALIAAQQRCEAANINVTYLTCPHVIFWCVCCISCINLQWYHTNWELWEFPQIEAAKNHFSADYFAVWAAERSSLSLLKWTSDLRQFIADT